MWKPLGEYHERWEDAHRDALLVKRLVQYVMATVRVAKVTDSYGRVWYRAEVL